MRRLITIIDLCVENFRTFGLSTLHYIADMTAIAVPPLRSLLGWAFNRWVRGLLTEGLAARHCFDEHLYYEIQLWQLSKPDTRDSRI